MIILRHALFPWVRLSTVLRLLFLRKEVFPPTILNFKVKPMCVAWKKDFVGEHLQSLFSMQRT